MERLIDKVAVVTGGGGGIGGATALRWPARAPRSSWSTSTMQRPSG